LALFYNLLHWFTNSYLYFSEVANTASVAISSVNTNTEWGTYTLDPALNSTTIDVSALATGIYSVILICDGQIVDVETLSVN
jgi:hypothetical protein